MLSRAFRLPVQPFTNRGQVFHESRVIQLALSRVARAQDGRRMDRGGDGFCRRIGKESPTLLKKAVVRPDDGVGSRGAQTNNQPRLDDGELRLEPWLAGRYFGGRWLLVDPSLAAFFELKMFDGVGEVDVPAFDSRAGEGAVRNTPAGPTNGRPARSSLSPGCSPINTIRAPTGPSPRTAWVAARYSSQP